MPTRLQDNISADQTAFVEHMSLGGSGRGRKFDWRQLRQNKNLLPFYVLLGGFAVFALLLFIWLNVANRPRSEEAALVREQAQVDLSPLQTRVYQLRQELRDSDPTKQQLPFPSVDLVLSIE
jgi:hypothetical protein